MINKKEKTIQSVIVGQDDLLYPTQPFQILSRKLVYFWGKRKKFENEV